MTMAQYQTVIRGGMVVDGTGAAPRVADVAISDGRIVAIDRDLGPGKTEYAAAGRLVTPGFVDIHTHYDGQACWSSQLAPSSFHGVTTAVIGNCGVGFAPCRQTTEAREGLIRLMEGVEDIPHPVLAQGLPWTWESFPEYLDFLAGRSFDMDVLALLPHAALRVYVMGQRGVRREPATAEDIDAMCRLLGEALDHGALGIATSRTLLHRSSDGERIPTYGASRDELLALARVLRDRGRGIFQLVEDFASPDASLAGIRELAAESGRPVTFSLGVANQGPRVWPRLLQELRQANEEGLVIKAQVMPRAIGLILGVELTLNPFYTTPTGAELSRLPLAERLAEMRRPEIRAAILSEQPDPKPSLMLGRMVRNFDVMYLLGETPDYEQPPERSIAALAARAGVSPEEYAYDILVDGRDGGKLYLAMANMIDGSLDTIGEILAHPDVVLGLGDGGAHVATICDASYSTYALAHWARDRARDRKPVEDMVHRMTGATAAIAGLPDRGVLRPGLRADINVIDHARLQLHAPEVHYDLPAGGRRLLQKASGYELTMVAGQIVSSEGQPSGLLPGSLVRSFQAERETL